MKAQTIVYKTIISFAVSIMFTLLLPPLAAGQRDGRVGGAEHVTVRSNPIGALVTLDGIYSFTGRTPFVMPYVISGQYKVKATKEGYESLTTKVHFSGEGDDFVILNLHPKTRLKAAYRSLFVPGWGQFYSGNKLRGILISTAQLFWGVRTLIAINDYNNSKDDLDGAFEHFNKQLDEISYQKYQSQLQATQHDYNFRRTMLIITGALWAYNVLDAIVFFAPKGTQVEFRSQPLTYSTDSKSVMISWKIGL